MSASAPTAICPSGRVRKLSHIAGNGAKRFGERHTFLYTVNKLRVEAAEIRGHKPADTAVVSITGRAAVAVRTHQDTFLGYSLTHG